ncbi:hypothetical protein [Ruania albidiflava]|uniref:hypothetical protein n=1 Tax=Ruania albidiflava TaxID=366586 RepID=UPI0003B656F4|nr:hypothetical protein [Ruania albidiflava]
MRGPQHENQTNRASRTWSRVRLVLTVVVASAGTIGALLLVYVVLAPLYLGVLARLFAVDERLHARTGVALVHGVLAFLFAAPLVVGVMLTVRGGATVRRRVPRPGTRRPQVARWRWVLLGLAGAYTIMVAFGTIGGRRARLLPAELADRIGDVSPAGAELLQQAAYPTLALLVYSFAYLRWMTWLVRGGPRRRGWVYLTGAAVVVGLVAAITGAQYR